MEEHPDGNDVAYSWHPYTQMSEYLGGARLHIVRARGCWLEDVQGRRYLDGYSSIWTNVHGHGDPELDEALKAQLGRMAHSTLLGLNHPAAAALSAELSSLTSGRLSRVFFSDCGAMAVEVAVKLSLQYWQLCGHKGRRRIVAMEHAYHGDSFGTMALGDSGGFHERFQPWMFPVERMPAPLHEECAGKVRASGMGESLRWLDRYLAGRGGETACLVLEPSVQGAAGMRQQPPGFVSAVAERCRAAGVHFILDEIFVGFGRLGELLVSEAEGVKADFLCLAKGLTAGYLPLGATLASEEVFNAFLGRCKERKTFFHGQTFTGNPLACAVALKSIEKLRRPGVLDGMRLRAEVFGAALERALGGHANVPGLRQRGFAACIDLSPGDRSLRWHPDTRAAHRVCLEARRRGLVLRALGDSIPIVPPPVVTEEEIGFLAGVLRESIDAVMPGLPAESISQ